MIQNGCPNKQSNSSQTSEKSSIRLFPDTPGPLACHCGSLRITSHSPTCLSIYNNIISRLILINVPTSISSSVPLTQAPSPTFSDAMQSSWPSQWAHHSDLFISVNQVAFPGYDLGWSKGEQALFEMSVAGLTVSAGMLF